MNHFLANKPKDVNTVNIYQNEPIRKVHFRRKSEMQYSRNKVASRNRGLCSLINCCQKKTNHDSLYSISSIDNVVYNELSIARRANSVNSKQALPIKEKNRGEAEQVRTGNKSYAHSNGTEYRPTKSFYEETVKNKKPFHIKSSPNTSTSGMSAPVMNPLIQGYYRKNPNNENKVEEVRKTVYVYGRFPSSETKHCYTKKQINSFTEKDKNINAQPNNEKEYATYTLPNSVIPTTHYNNTYCDDNDDLSKDYKNHDKNHFDALENYKYVGYVLKSDRQSRSKYKPKEIDIYNNMIENKNAESTQLSQRKNSESCNKEEEESEASTEKNLIKNTQSMIKSKTNHTNSQHSENLKTTEQDQKEPVFSFKKNKTEKSNTDSSVDPLITTEIENIYKQNEIVYGNDQNGNSRECENSKHMKMNIDFFNMDENMNISITKGNNINVPEPILRKNTVLDQIEQKPNPVYVNHECQTLENYAPKKLMKRKRRIRIIRRIKRKRTTKRKPKKRISLKKKTPVYRVRKTLSSKSKKRLPTMKGEAKKKPKRKNKFIMKKKPQSKVSQKPGVQNDTKKKTHLNQNGFKQHTRKPRNTKITHKSRSVDKEHDEQKYVRKESSIQDSMPIRINHNKRNDPTYGINGKTKDQQIAESLEKIKDKETKIAKGGKELKESSLNKRNQKFMQLVDVYDTFHNSTQVNEKIKPGYVLKYNDEYILNGSTGNSKTAPNIYVSIQIDNMHKDMEIHSPDSTYHEKKRNVQDLKGTEEKNDINNSVTKQKNEFIRENEPNNQNQRNTQVIPPIDIIGYRLKAQECLKNQINEEFSNSRRIKDASNGDTMNSAQPNQAQNLCTNQIHNVSIRNSVKRSSKELLHRKQTDSLNDKEKNPRQVTSSSTVVEENDISPLVKNLINMLNEIAQGKSEPIESNELEPSTEQPYNEGKNLDFSVNQENDRSFLQDVPKTNTNNEILNPMNEIEELQKIHQFTQSTQEGKPTSNGEKINFLLYFISFYSQKLKNIINLSLKNTYIDDRIFNMKFFILCLVHLVENRKFNSTRVITTEFCIVISDLLDKITKCVIKSLENKVEKYQLMLIKIYLIELLKHTKLLQLCVDEKEGKNDIENIQMDEIMKIDNMLLQRNATRLNGEDTIAKQDPLFQANIGEEFLRDLHHNNTMSAKRENPINRIKSDRVNEILNNQVPYNVIKSKTIHHPVVLKLGNNKSVVSMVNFDIPHEKEGNIIYPKTKKENSYKADSLGSANILHKNKEPNNIKYKINKLKEEIIQEKVNNSYNKEQQSFLLNHLDYLQEICQGNSKFHLTKEEKLIREEYISHVLERIREIVKKQIRYIEDYNKRSVSTKKYWTSEDKKIRPLYDNTSSCTISPKHTNSDELPELDSSWFTTEMIHTESTPNVKRIIRNYKRNSNFDEAEELKELNKSLNTIILSKDKLLHGKTTNYYNIIKMCNDDLTLLSDVTIDHYTSDHETENRTDDEYFNHMNREQFYNFITWIKKHKEDEHKIDKSQAIRNFEMTNMKSDVLKNLYSTFVEQEKRKSETKNLNYINKMLTVDREDLENSNPFHNLEDTYNDKTCNSSMFNNEDNVLSEYQTFKENGENENVQYFKIGS